MHPPLAELAERQGGVVSHAQLLEIGLGRRAVEHRAQVGELHRVHHGVYAVGHPSLTPRGRLHAALLAVPSSVLSHRTAAAQWDLIRTPSGRIEVTAPRRGRRSTASIHVHTARDLRPDDVTTHDGLPTTTVARTLLDLAAALPRPKLGRALEQAVLTHRFDRQGMEEVLARASGRTGTTALRTALRELTDAPPPPAPTSNGPSSPSVTDTTSPFPR